MSADTLEQPSTSAPRNPRSDVAVDLVIPVYNEEKALETSVRRLDGYLRTQLPFPYRITIADNASTDRTREIAQRLEQEIPQVHAFHMDAKGRGRALKAAWATSRADVVGYMDVDLSTDLRAIAPLVAPLLSGHSDLSIGTRLAHGSRVVRGPKRDLISRSYNLLLRWVLSARFTDAQCGFKAVRRDIADRLLPLVEDDSWFFDTEILVLASEAGLRIHEVPVDWVDDPDSRVDIVKTAREDLNGVWRLLRGLTLGRIDLDPVAALVPITPKKPSLPVQLVRFATIGVLSTLAYLVLYALAREAVPAQVANLAALLVTAVGNTAANRRLTFGVTSRRGVVRDHLAGLAAFGIGLALTAGSLALLHGAVADPPRVTEMTVLTCANALATLVRFLVLRRVVSTPRTT
ncbi:MAG: bifunctional glycosyltransferase family 2/GtrA family protein [Nocardioides sp.]|nr:bifunctional glycosyltransferase family 2/GtrA family protein [Nocardioides sp.]